MSNQIKDEIDKIQLPPELHQRSVMGIKQARLEGNGTRNNRSKSLIIASILGIILCASVIFNSQVAATIQKALQFIPGIGIVKENDNQVKRYLLQEPVTVPVGNGTIVITGMVVDEEMTFITMDGTNVPKLDSIKIINHKGTEFIIERSIWSGGSKGWVSSFWHQGQLDIQEKISVVFEGDSEIKVPITLEQAKSFNSLNEVGEVDNVNGIKIAAIPSLVGEQVRISLISQHSKDFRVNDYGINGAGTEYQKLYVMDETGKKYNIEKYRGISSPSREFYFDRFLTDNRVYTIVIPEINVDYDDKVEISLPIPLSIEEDVNQTFEIAGFPVTITKLERFNIEGVNEIEGLRIHVDVKYDESAKESLHDFNFAGLSTMFKLNEQTRVVEYIELEIEPDSKTIHLTIERPQVIVRGPWRFEIPATEYFGK